MARDTIGAWLPAMVAQRFGLPPAIARDVVAVVLEAVDDDLARAARALERGDPDLGVAARCWSVRIGYARGRIGAPEERRARISTPKTPKKARRWRKS
jgi:hypothetical protein